LFYGQSRGLLRTSGRPRWTRIARSRLRSLRSLTHICRCGRQGTCGRALLRALPKDIVGPLHGAIERCRSGRCGTSRRLLSRGRCSVPLLASVRSTGPLPVVQRCSPHSFLQKAACVRLGPCGNERLRGRRLGALMPLCGQITGPVRAAIVRGHGPRADRRGLRRCRVVLGPVRQDTIQPLPFGVLVRSPAVRGPTRALAHAPLR
jgi:hypothetical protein